MHSIPTQVLMFCWTQKSTAGFYLSITRVQKAAGLSKITCPVAPRGHWTGPDQCSLPAETRPSGSSERPPSPQEEAEFPGPGLRGRWLHPSLSRVREPGEL